MRCRVEDSKLLALHFGASRAISYLAAVRLGILHIPGNFVYNITRVPT